MKTKLLILGGFLGAGKTTLLGQLAKELGNQGKKIGLITNDQASGLVDTKLLEANGGQTQEVSGSCFCCNFPGFAAAIENFQEAGIDIIIAEPVGSCTDLSATILQPLKDKYADSLSIAAFSVLADAKRIAAIIKGENDGLHDSAAYIVKKQLEEADFIVINKTEDMSAEAKEALIADAQKGFSLAKVYAISAINYENVTPWLEDALSSELVGSHILQEIDYDTYAEGEAVLGWLNTDITLKAENVDWAEFLNNLLSSFANDFDKNGNSVGHVKALITESDHCIVGNIVGDSSTLKVRGTSNKDAQVSLVFNARVEMSPDDLALMVKEKIDEFTKDMTCVINEWKCLMPGYPDPTYRYKEIV